MTNRVLTPPPATYDGSEKIAYGWGQQDAIEGTACNNWRNLGTKLYAAWVAGWESVKGQENNCGK